MRKTLLCSVLLAIAAAPVACSKTQAPAVTPTPTADAGAPEAGAIALAPADAGPPADAGVPIAADAGGSALSADAADLAIDAAVKAAAAKVAPKMEPEGQPGRATLAQGERFNMIVTLQPNRCYTIIGYSPTGGVTQLDLKLMAPPI